MSKKTSKKSEPARRIAKSKSTIELRPRKSAARLFQDVEDGGEGELTLSTPGEQEMQLADLEFTESSPLEIQEKDVFVDAVKLAREKMTSVRFRIYRDGELLTTRDAGYSWERLQTELGGGYYKISAVDRDNLWLGSETKQVAHPPGWEQRNAPQQTAQREEKVDSIDQTERIYNILDGRERRIEEKYRGADRSSSDGIAQIISASMQSQSANQTAMMTMMQENARQTQTLIMEMNKSSMQMFTLLAQNNSSKKGDELSASDLFKMQIDMEKRAEERLFKNEERLEKKVKDLVELRTEAMERGDDDEEKPKSLMENVLTGLIPLLQRSTQQNQAPAGMSPEQQQALIQEQQMAHGREIEARRKAAGIVSQPGAPLAQIERPRATKNPPQAGGNIDRQALLKTRVIEFMKERNVAGLVQEGVAAGHEASKVAETVLSTLENSGLPRQTVAGTLTRTDLEGLALDSGLPKELLESIAPWITEFYDHVQKFRKVPIKAPVAATSAQPSAVVGSSSAAVVTEIIESGKGIHANGAASVAAVPAPKIVRKTPARKSTQEPSQNI